MTPSGKGNVTRTETVKANSRKTFSMAEHSGIQGRASIMVTSKTSGRKVMVERAMYWNSRGAGTDTIGGYGD
jgi:predicted homoserine dehydrogenase-like protein